MLRAKDITCEVQRYRAIFVLSLILKLSPDEGEKSFLTEDRAELCDLAQACMKKLITRLPRGDAARVQAEFEKTFVPEQITTEFIFATASLVGDMCILCRTVVSGKTWFALDTAAFRLARKISRICPEAEEAGAELYIRMEDFMRENL